MIFNFLKRNNLSKKKISVVTLPVPYVELNSRIIDIFTQPNDILKNNTQKQFLLFRFLMAAAQFLKNKYDVVLSHYKNNIKEEQMAIFYVVCTQITQSVAVDLLKKFRKEQAVVLKTYDTLAQARSFADALIAAGGRVDIHIHHDTSPEQSDKGHFSQQMMKFQVSVGIAVLFIAFVTKSGWLALLSVFFILLMLTALKSPTP